MTDIGCRQREICEAYNDQKYLNSPILADNFRIRCDTEPQESFVIGFCPLYDIYQEIFKFTEKLLTERNKRFSKK